MAFGPSPFQCRLFHGRDALQNALARSPGPAVMKERPALPASAPDLGRTVKQTSTHPIGDRGPLPGRPEGPSILGQAAIYWTLPRIMFSSFTLARADKTLKPAWSGRRDCPQAGIRSINPPITMIRQRRPAEKRSEHGLSTLERIQIIGQRARQLNASAKSRTSPPSVAPLLHPYSRSDS